MITMRDRAVMATHTRTSLIWTRLGFSGLVGWRAQMESLRAVIFT